MLFLRDATYKNSFLFWFSTTLNRTELLSLLKFFTNFQGNICIHFYFRRKSIPICRQNNMGNITESNSFLLASCFDLIEFLNQKSCYFHQYSTRYVFHRIKPAASVHCLNKIFINKLICILWRNIKMKMHQSYSTPEKLNGNIHCSNISKYSQIHKK